MVIGLTEVIDILEWMISFVHKK